ncbi:MAG: hypothetical protein WAP04_00320 [Bacillota bacterium]|nr:hypothetical protein [Bacillota bacterium]
MKTKGGLCVLRKCPKCGKEEGREYTIGITVSRQGLLYTYWMECEACRNKWQAVRIKKS